ncbi:hypothetical protein CY34DRAFT_16062 [Suillus luteus UH-Slu-Lm8-n1]|uniref:Uncharacterized protein n=1 Tax=Suillus luteus UH-Slu-Lm8-n1 TaxID=930992 RepID=A0A0D0AYI4_9AGAM|nr:hypothetical protein CY34DRAFT_16062 [Suillus luteus UH-Slu-Lm8-n1]
MKSLNVLAITHSKAKKIASTPPEKTPTTQPPSDNVVKHLLESTNLTSEKQLIQKTPDYTYESKASAPQAAQHVYQNMLNMVVSNLTIADLLTISPDLRSEAVNHCCTQRVPAPPVAISANTSTVLNIPPQVDHGTPLRELRVTINGVHSEIGLLDEGL